MTVSVVEVVTDTGDFPAAVFTDLAQDRLCIILAGKTSSGASGITAPSEAVMRQLASIGPETSRALEQLGLTPTAEAAPHTIDGLVSALERHVRSKQP